MNTPCDTEGGRGLTSVVQRLEDLMDPYGVAFKDWGSVQLLVPDQSSAGRYSCASWPAVRAGREVIVSSADPKPGLSFRFILLYKRLVHVL